MRTMMLILAALVGFALQNADAQPRYERQQVVYHINGDGGEGGRQYRAALQNMQNHMEAVGARNLTIHVVMHGDGLNLLRLATRDPQLQATIDNLKIQNVRFLVCNFTMLRRTIALGELYEAADDDVVPSGVAEIAHLQQRGFSYLRP